MDTYRITITPKAGDDLKRIYDYVAKSSPQNAALLIDRILDTIQTLVHFPNRTIAERQSPKLRHPVRTLPVRPYIIYFRVVTDSRVVLTVRHAARRRPRRFDR